MLYSVKKYFFIVCLLIEIITAVNLNVNDDVCTSQRTCSQCLRQPYCIWCSDPLQLSSHNNVSLTRCVNKMKYEVINNNWCSSKYVVFGNSSVSKLTNEPLSRDSKHPVQVQPQKMKVALRLGEELTIQFNYTKSEDYPVDLYYLMDVSYSMGFYRDKLINLGDHLAETMKKLTSNFRIGFGSFIDKPIMPMAGVDKTSRSTEENMDNFSFRNNMPLTTDLYSFKHRVSETKLTGNYDTTEAVFDGIMQAIACTKEVGWRKKARHILVVCTDAESHVAGDGKYAGIIEPNDELCHLKNGYYDYSILQDYPSVSQVDRKVKENNINLIFSVPKKVSDYYKELSQRITGSSVGILENNAKNVVSLIYKEYEKLVDSVVMTDNAPNIINTRYLVKCPNSNAIQERKDCTDVRYGDVVTFDVVLKALECPSNPNKWHQTIKIGPRDLAENLELEVKLICDCKDCENSKNQSNIAPSDICKNNATLDCGICKCADGFYGKKCECTSVNESDQANGEGCKMPNSTEICSGRGTCICNECICEERSNPEEKFSGTYCEQDNFSCNRKDGLVCGGRGICEYGKCHCFSDWLGETCDCTVRNNTCMASFDSDVVCSGKGDCICGTCHCHETENFRYSGKFCEESPTSPDKHCTVLKNCIECLGYKSGPLWQNNECDDVCYQMISNLTILNRIDEYNKENEISNSKVCRLPTDGSCTFLFRYEVVHSDKLEAVKFIIQVQKNKDCPVPINTLGVSLGVIIATLVIGFFILTFWKVYTFIQDEIEFAKFEKQRAAVKWNQSSNPIYRSAITTVQNPTCNSTS